MISKTQAYKVGSLILTHLFLLTLFKSTTIILFWLSVLFVWSYVKLRIKNVLRNGLIGYLPQKLRAGLTQRSLFDILCDIWFMPVTMNILKVLAKPFITSVKPDQAASILNQLSPQVRKHFLRKGIVNILPQNMKEVLISKQLRMEMDKKELSALVSMSSLRQIPSLLNQKPHYKESTSDTLNNRRKGDKLRLAMTRDFQDEQSLQQSSSIGEQVVESKQQGNHKWDKLEIYHRIKQSLQSGKSMTQIVKNNLGILRNILQLNSVLVTKVSPWKVTKYFAFFAVVLIFQMRLTTQNKKAILNLINLLVSLATVLGLAGTGGLLAYKVYRSRQTTRSITNSE